MQANPEVGGTGRTQSGAKPAGTLDPNARKEAGQGERGMTPHKEMCKMSAYNSTQPTGIARVLQSTMVGELALEKLSESAGKFNATPFAVPR